MMAQLFLCTCTLYFSSFASLPVPRNSLLKLDATATKDVQRAANSQINLATAQLLHQLQILQVASATCICNWNGADRRQKLHKLGVDTSLFTFDVGGVDQKLRAVRLKECDVFLEKSVGAPKYMRRQIGRVYDSLFCERNCL
jgi:hypothetical protein